MGKRTGKMQLRGIGHQSSVRRIVIAIWFRDRHGTSGASDNRRLLGPTGDISRVELEQGYYEPRESRVLTPGISKTGLPMNRRGSSGSRVGILHP